MRWCDPTTGGAVCMRPPLQTITVPCAQGVKGGYATLDRRMKISQIHGLRRVLWTKTGFCRTMNEVRRGFEGKMWYVFRCWSLPREYDDLYRDISRRAGTPCTLLVPPYH